MERFPLVLAGKTVGEVTVERAGLYLSFSARADLPEGVWCVRLVGEQGSLRLGVPEPKNGESVLRRRISAREAASAGRFLRGEAESLLREEHGWQPIPPADELFRADWLFCRLELCRGALFRREGERLLLVLPYDRDEPFWLETLFCFARIRQINGREFAVFAFDGAEQPLFP